MREKDSVPPSSADRRPLLLTAVIVAIVAAVAGGVGFALGCAGSGGSPLDGRPSSGAVLARFDGGAVTAGELEALLGPKDGPLRAQLRGPAARKEFVEGWTRTLLLARRTEAEGFHRTSEFARSYAQELPTAFVEKKLDESADGRPLTDDEVRAWFVEHEKELQRPERVRLAIMSFDAPAAAARARKLGVAQAALAAARERPLDPLAFGNLARVRSEDPRTRALNGELPPMSREELTSLYGPELAAAAFELFEAGAILPRVVETPSRLHVVKLVVREPEQRPTFEDVKEVLRQRLTSERRSRGRRAIVEAAVRDAGMKIDEKAMAGIVGRRVDSTATSARALASCLRRYFWGEECDDPSPLSPRQRTSLGARLRASERRGPRESAHCTICPGRCR